MWKFSAEAFPPGSTVTDIAWCSTAASSQVKQKQWRGMSTLKMLEMESVVSSPLLLDVMIERDC